MAGKARVDRARWGQRLALVMTVIPVHRPAFPSCWDPRREAGDSVAGGVLDESVGDEEGRPIPGEPGLGFAGPQLKDLGEEAADVFRPTNSQGWFHCLGRSQAPGRGWTDAIRRALRVARATFRRAAAFRLGRTERARLGPSRCHREERARGGLSLGARWEPRAMVAGTSGFIPAIMGLGLDMERRSATLG